MNSQRSPFEVLFSCLALLGGLTALVTALYFARAGFDFTDEGFYLSAIAGPSGYVASLSLFAEIYHPVFVLLDGSIYGLRIFNIVLSYAASFVLSLVVVHRYLTSGANGSSAPLERAMTWAMAVGFGSAAMSIVSIHGKWLATPSYNTLAFAGLLVTATAVAILLADEQKRSTGAWALLGLGGALTFLGKPSTAALLAPTTVLAMLLARRISSRGCFVAVGTVCASLFVYAVLAHGSFGNFAHRMLLGVRLLELQTSGYDLPSVFARLTVIPTGRRALAFYALTIALVASAWWIGHRYAKILLPLFFASGVAASFVFYRIDTNDAYLFSKETIVQFLLTLTVFGACMWLAFASRLDNIKGQEGRRLALSAYLLALPLIYAFGTNNNYFSQANMAGVFWILGSLLFVSTLLQSANHRWFLPVAAFFVAGSSICVVFMAAESPYRQGAPLTEAEERVQVGVDQAPVYVTRARAEFVRTVQVAAQRAGFAHGHHTIDLTGAAPGVLFTYGSRGVGQAWLIGTSAAARESLRHVPCAELSTAWVLSVESPTKRSLDPLLLQSFGASLDTSYTAVARWAAPFETGVQVLYRPKRDVAEAVRACNSSRLPDPPQPQPHAAIGARAH